MKHASIAAILACAALSRAEAQTTVETLTITINGRDAELTWRGVPADPAATPPYALYSAGYLDQPFTEIADAIDMAVETDRVDPTIYRAGIHLPEWDTTYFFGVYTRPDGILYTVQGSTESEPDLVAPAAVTLAATSWSGSVTLTWTAPGDDGLAGRAQCYDLRYSTTGPLDASMWNDNLTVIVTGLPHPGPSGQAESLTLNGLAAGVTHHFALKTADDVPNWSVMSNSVRVTVIADTVAPAATSLVAAAAADDAVTLAWEAPGDDGMLGVASAYELRYSTAGPIVTDAEFAVATPVTGLPAPAPAGTSQGLRHDGLAPNTTYHFAMRAFDEAAQASPLAGVSVQTLQILGSSGATQACSAGGLPGGLPLVLAWLAAGLLLRR